MDNPSDHDSDGFPCEHLESRPWSEHPPHLNAMNFGTSPSQAEQTYIDKEQRRPLSNNSSSISTPLRTQLTKAMCRSLDGKSRSFLPKNYIDTITPCLVKEELALAMPTLLESVLDKYTAQILGSVVNDATGQERNLRQSNLELKGFEARLLKTFTILILIGKVETVPSFIASGFADSLLPIGHARSQHGNSWRCFDKWTMSSIRDFIETQWVVLSPFLSSPTTDVSLYNFPRQMILPLFDDNSTAPSSIKLGGYSAVRKVGIHHQHHSFGENQEKPYFALKKLRSPHIEDFQREVAALRPFVASPHPHVVKLLAAFRHDTSFYLLFPWAEGGSLHSFWKDHAKPTPDISLSRWISEQSLGIATALSQIHHGHQPRGTDPHFSGRHGDIKPPNILLFLERAPNKNFVWKLSDFGLGRQNRHPEKRDDRPIGFTPTYRAPELDIKGTINSAYDVWSLGCVFLELLTWMACGWEGVRSFALSRVDADQKSSKAEEVDDGFFRIIKRQGGSLDAQLKTSVTLWVNNLAADKTLSPHVADFMNFTRNDLLDTNWETRASISRVVENLQCLRQRCLEDPTYTVAIPRPRKPPWSPRKLISLHQSNSSILKSQTLPTNLNMNQLPSSNGPNSPDSMTVPSQASYWKDFDKQSYDTNDTEIFNYALANMTSMEGVLGNHQLGAQPHQQTRSKRRVSPEKSILGNQTSRRRTIDNATGYSKTSDEPRRKKVRKKGDTTTKNVPKDKSPQTPERGTFQKINCEVAGSSEPAPEKLFACPFYKHNPERYNTKAWKACAVPEGRTISRLKEHIYRKHFSDRHRCNRCSVEFNCISDLQQHCRSEVRCPIQDSHVDIDTIDNAQKHEMQKKQRGISEEEKWENIYRIIFRLDPTCEVPSPYCDALEAKSSAGGDDHNDYGTVAEFKTYLHQRLADGGGQDASQITTALALVTRFQHERAQDPSVATTLSETIPPLTFDCDPARASASRDGYPTSTTLATADDSLPSADFDKVFASDVLPYSFLGTFQVEEEDGTLPGG
ncbi:uncharacterized protein F4812DRAFT_446854 [Daldinia caldariorum]|uniref:uncharacterized protein n=1 Tax=Daldinia caldariorum TaxID=326644 RepID=UPI002008C814|nr:uncharacterized protein F4812DRAFT_446854 [Daldinia caldariorum]KAI1463413.1 hypothetical protein F4812DRAFT_446854 [Daldinia caldariorum]